MPRKCANERRERRVRYGAFEASLASSPTPRWLRKASRPVSGLARHETPAFPHRTDAVAKTGASLSLTVAGAVQVLHLIPVHLASAPMIMHEAILAKTRLTA